MNPVGSLLGYVSKTLLRLGRRESLPHQQWQKVFEVHEEKASAIRVETTVPGVIR